MDGDGCCARLARVQGQLDDPAVSIPERHRPQELDLAQSYLTQGTVEQYAKVLLSTNEEIFWP